MSKPNYLSPILGLLLLTGCASPGGPTLISTAVGMVLGGGIGALVDPGPAGRARGQNIFAGATIGAGLGATAGFVHEQLSQIPVDPLAKAKEPKAPPTAISQVLPAPQIGIPTVAPATVEQKFIDDQYRGNIYVPGHFEFEIKEPARWSR